MIELTYPPVPSLNGLHDAIEAAAIPALKSDDGEAVYRVSGDRDQTVIAVPDLGDTESAALKKELDELVAAAVTSDTAVDDDLRSARDRRSHTVRQLLAETDWWLVRAYENGSKVSAPRKAYRQALRETLAEIAVSEMPETVKLPDPPTA